MYVRVFIYHPVFLTLCQSGHPTTLGVTQGPLTNLGTVQRSAQELMKGIYTTEHFDQAVQILSRGSPAMRHLRESVRQVGKEVERLDTQGGATPTRSSSYQYAHPYLASNWLRRMRIVSPPSTIVIRSKVWNQIADPAVQRTIVRRLLRYCSAKPWGSLAAIADGRNHRLLGIPDKMQAENLVQFSSGGQVLWTPATLVKRDDIRFRLPRPKTREDELVWILQRAKPFAERAPEATVDLTPVLSEEKGRYATYLWDNRFLFMIDKSGMESNGRLMVKPADRFFLPQITIEHDGRDDEVVGEYKLGKRLNASPSWVGVPWIRVKSIRTLSML